MSKKSNGKITRKIGPKKKHDSLVTRVQPEPAKDIIDLFKQLHQQRPKGIISDIELLEERARWALNKKGEKQEQYHSLSSQHQCAEKTLEHTKLLRHAIESGDINLAVYSALRAAGQAERIILHHWEYSTRLGQEYHNQQTNKSRSGNEVRWNNEDNNVLEEIIQNLALKKDYLGDPLPPKDLWPLLYDALDNRRLNPKELNGDSKTNKLIEAIIQFGDQGEITYETFRKRVNRYR